MHRFLFALAAVFLALPGCSSCSKSSDSAGADAATGALTPDASKAVAALDSGIPEIPDMGKDQVPVDQQIAAIDATKLGVTGPDDPKFKQLGLIQKLAVEKAYQPANALKSTTVYDALKTKLSIPVNSVHQIAGYRVDASYCDRGETDLKVDVMVCEFRDDTSAIKSRAAVLKLPDQGGRVLTAVKGSWISVTVFGKDPNAVAQQKKIVDFVGTL